MNGVLVQAPGNGQLEGWRENKHTCRKAKAINRRGSTTRQGSWGAEKNADQRRVGASKRPNALAISIRTMGPGGAGLTEKEKYKSIQKGRNRV